MCMGSKARMTECKKLETTMMEILTEKLVLISFYESKFKTKIHVVFNAKRN